MPKNAKHANTSAHLMTSIEQPPKGTREVFKANIQTLWKDPHGGALWAGSTRHEAARGNSTGPLTSSLPNEVLPLVSMGRDSRLLLTLRMDKKMK